MANIFCPFVFANAVNYQRRIPFP